MEPADITINDQDDVWTDRFGVKYTKDKRCLLQAPMELKKYCVHKDTKIISNKAFYISKIESIVLPKDLICIGDAAFCGCINLKEIGLSNSITEIGESAFSGCI